MFKKLALAAFLLTNFHLAFAQVDVNKADQTALDGIRGVGPKLSSAILDERKKGDFKDWRDLENRVKEIGGKSAVRLSNAGLTVNGQARTASAAEDAKAGDKKASSKAAGQPAAAKVEAKKESVQ